jgi:hypothetical protein
MATKALRQQARQWVETLESRLHVGPPPGVAEIQSARDFLRQHDFPAASDYFHRLNRLEGSLAARRAACAAPKRNYGGRAAGLWLQVQSVHDHVLVSACYEGEFRLQRARVKLTHRFNTAGRVDFVELKFLRALDARLDGAVRKLVLVRDFAARPREWFEAEAFVLRVLPRELILIEPDVFRCARAEIVGWLVNLGHWTVEQALADLAANRGDGGSSPRQNARCAAGATPESAAQRDLPEVLADPVALPILKQAAALRIRAECDASELALLRYLRQPDGAV